MIYDNSIPMKILVTGSEGFIGSHLTEELVKLGYDVRAFIMYNSFNSNGWLNTIPSEIKKKIDFFYGDIRDSELVKNATRNCNVIFHLAALIGIPYSYIASRSYIETNVIGTLNLLNAIKDTNIHKFIHTSTSEVYGTAQYIPIDEKHPLNAQSPYAASKTAADQLVLSYTKSFKIPSIIIRPFNTFGPRQSLRAIIPTIITQLIQNSDQIKLGSLTPTRDFTYIEDTVDALILSLKSQFQYSEIFNLGTGYEISIKSLAELISKKMGKDTCVFDDDIRKRPINSEVERLISNNEKAINELSWNPKYVNENGFNLALDKTIKWFKDNKNLINYSSNYIR